MGNTNFELIFVAKLNNLFIRTNTFNKKSL